MQKSEVLTIMIVDIVGFTQKTTQSMRHEIADMQKLFDDTCKPVFSKYDIKIIKKMGDAFLLTCRSATDSIEAARELQSTFNSFNKNKPKKEKIIIRVAINTGEVTIIDNDIYGDAVNTTARIEGITKPGHIVFSESTYLSMNKEEIPYIFLGRFQLKGIKPINLFRVPKGMKVRKQTVNIFAIILIILLIGALVSFAFIMSQFV